MVDWPMTRADGKRDRDEMFVEYANICPCEVVVDAQVNIRRQGVLRKRCRESTEVPGRVCRDAQMYLESARFNKPEHLSAAVSDRGARRLSQ